MIKWCYIRLHVVAISYYFTTDILNENKRVWDFVSSRFESDVSFIVFFLKLKVVFLILPKQWIVDYILEMEIIVWHLSVLWRAAYRRQYFGNTILAVVDFYKYALLIFRQCLFYGVASFCFFDFYFGNIKYYWKDGQRSDF